MQKGKFLTFRLNEIPTKRPEPLEAPKYFFKFGASSDVKLIRHTLEDNGFREITGNRNLSWSLLWSNVGYTSHDYEKMTKYQRINHFPKSYELTRKDLLYNRMVNM